MNRHVTWMWPVLMLAACGVTASPQGGGFVVDGGDALADTTTLDVLDGLSGDVPADAPVGPADPCTGATAGDGTYCGSAMEPVPGDLAIVGENLYTCSGGVQQKWQHCDSGCIHKQPGHDFCAPVVACGDDVCNGLETCTTCPKDCGACPVDPCTGASLGDGVYCSASLTPPSPQKDTLYTCKAKKTVSAQVCPYGCNVAPKGTADSCKPKPSGTALGKGVWVWNFGSSAPSAQQVAIDAQAMGIGFVLIKTGQDLSSYDTNFNASIVNEFTSRGIEVYGWPYVTPGNNAAKAAVIAKSAKIPGVKGIILDVETEFVKHDVDALELCDAIRKEVPGVFLGYTSFGWISYHLDFPFEAFDQACGDAFLPQVYWDLWSSTTPAKSYQTVVKDASNLGLKAPLWPIQDNEMDPDVAGLNAFFGVAGPRASLWRWPGSDNDPQFAKMQQLQWGN